jgi:hypothetical protein
VSGSAFKSGGGGTHEFKFGFGYLRNPNHSTTRWSGSEVVGSIISPTESYAKAYRARVVNFVGESTNAFFGDTFSMGRLTVNAGLRWDLQKASNQASDAPANTMFPDLLPALSFDGTSPSAGTTSHHAARRSRWMRSADGGRVSGAVCAS